MKGSKHFAPAAAAVLTLVCLAACGGVIPWDRSYNLRQWEKIRLAAESAFVDGDYALAEDLLRSAVQYAEKLGKNDFRLSTTLAQLGDALLKEGKLSDARSVYEQALARLTDNLRGSKRIVEQRLLAEDTAAVLLNLGTTCMQSGDLPSAEGYFQQAIDHHRQWQQRSGSQVLAEDFGQALAGLAVVKAKQGKTQGAAQVCKEALDSAAAAHFSPVLKERLERLYSAFGRAETPGRAAAVMQSDDRWRAYMVAGRDAKESKEYERSEEQYALAVEAAEKLGPDKVKLAEALQELAEAKSWLGKGKQSEETYRESLKLWEKLGPEGDSHVDKILSRLGNVAYGRGDYGAAYEVLSRQLAVRKSLFGSSDSAVGETLAELARTELALGKRSAAREHALAGWSILKQDQSTRGKTLVTVEALAMCLHALGEYKAAAAANDRVFRIAASKQKWNLFKTVALYRLASIYAQEQDVSKSAGKSREAAAQANILFHDPADRVTLLGRLNQQAAYLGTDGQFRSSAALSQWTLELLGPADRAGTGFGLIRIEALKNLSNSERKLGNNKRADRLDTEITRLESKRN